MAQKIYSPYDCMRKADQHWELAGMARQDGDKQDEKKHTEKARLWQDRAREGGYVNG